MLIKTTPDVRSSEITPQRDYLNRRRLLAGAGGMLLAGNAYSAKIANVKKSAFSTTEEQNSFRDSTTYNNFYELGTSKTAPAQNADRLKIHDWKVKVDGACAKPATFDLDGLMKLADMEERIYRMRCVEAWSIVVPWIGYSLSNVLKKVEPTAKAKYVAFESFYDPANMLSQAQGGIPFPYQEGLRLDEAMHPLTTLTFGMYGETLPNQNGAPVRLIVPWKYGFKGIKSIVRIRLVEKEPPCSWKIINPSEYGFYSNVNPQVDHPRWTQASERRLGEFGRRKTLMFNGYGDQVASLYAGMDLKKNY